MLYRNQSASSDSFKPSLKNRGDHTIPIIISKESYKRRWYIEKLSLGLMVHDICLVSFLMSYAPSKEKYLAI